MADISIHNAKAIRIGEIREINGNTPLYVREIVITDDKNNETTITCYSNKDDEGDCLKVSL
jgi:hypothetical protein